MKLNREFRIFTDPSGPEGRKLERDTNGDLLIDMAFSSEKPVERWFGFEVLSHDAGAINMERLNDGAPVLFNHNLNELRGTHIPGTFKVGEDKMLRGRIRVTAATEAGREAVALIDSGVLTKSSVGYMVDKMIEQGVDEHGRSYERDIDVGKFERTLAEMGFKEGNASMRHIGSGVREEFVRRLDAAHGFGVRKATNKIPTYRVVKWTPYENSLVTIPADSSVGVGRSEAGAPGGANQPADNATSEGLEMPGSNNGQGPAGDAGNANRGGSDAAQAINTNAAAAAAAAAAAGGSSASAGEIEQQRIDAIRNLGKSNNIDDRVVTDWIRSGASFKQISDDMLEIIERRGRDNPQPASRLGMSNQETQRYSVVRAILATLSGKWDKAGLELEASRAVSEKIGRPLEDNRFFVPFEFMSRGFGLDPHRAARDHSFRMKSWELARRDLTAGGSGSGAELVNTQNVSFIELLYARSVALRMGTRRLSGLVGNVTIPRLTAGASVTWLANEASSISESTQTLDQVSLSPKNVGGYTEISRQLMMQSQPAAESIVTDDIARSIGGAADDAILEGSGASGQPTGIKGTSGIGAVTGTSLAYAGIIEFQTDVAAANVSPVAGGYVTTATVAADMMQTVKFSGTASPVWVGNVWDGEMAGFPAMTSSQVAAASMLFGDWSESILAEWGVLEIEVNPYANFQAGIVGVRGMYSMDVGVRHPGAFSLATSIT